MLSFQGKSVEENSGVKGRINLVHNRYDWKYLQTGKITHGGPTM
jgi:hypothetical protein